MSSHCTFCRGWAHLCWTGRKLWLFARDTCSESVSLPSNSHPLLAVCRAAAVLLGRGGGCVCEYVHTACGLLQQKQTCAMGLLKERRLMASLCCRRAPVPLAPPTAPLVLLCCCGLAGGLQSQLNSEKWSPLVSANCFFTNTSHHFKHSTTLISSTSCCGDAPECRSNWKYDNYTSTFSTSLSFGEKCSWEMHLQVCGNTPPLPCSAPLLLLPHAWRCQCDCGPLHQGPTVWSGHSWR